MAATKLTPLEELEELRRLLYPCFPVYTSNSSYEPPLVHVCHDLYDNGPDNLYRSVTMCGKPTDSGYWRGTEDAPTCVSCLEITGRLLARATTRRDAMRRAADRLRAGDDRESVNADYEREVYPDE